MTDVLAAFLKLALATGSWFAFLSCLDAANGMVARSIRRHLCALACLAVALVDVGFVPASVGPSDAALLTWCMVAGAYAVSSLGLLTSGWTVRDWRACVQASVGVLSVACLTSCGTGSTPAFALGNASGLSAFACVLATAITVAATCLLDPRPCLSSTAS